MSYIHGTTIKELKSPDGARRFDIIARNDGLFQFYEYCMSSDPTEGWLMGNISGLYKTADIAEAEARTRYGLE